MFERLTPPEGRVPVCPVCGEECDTIVRGVNREVLGCNNCLEIMCAQFYEEEVEEEMMRREDMFRAEAFA